MRAGPTTCLVYRVGLIALLAWGCTGTKPRVLGGGGLPPDGGDPIEEGDGAVDPDGPTGDGARGSTGGTVWPVDGGLPSSTAGLTLRARLYSDTEYVRESWPPATSAAAGDGAFVEALHGCGAERPLVSVQLRGEAGNETGTTFRLALGANDAVSGEFVRTDRPAIRCSISEGHLTVTISESAPSSPAPSVVEERARGEYAAPCWLTEDGGVPIPSITVKGSFDLPVRRSALPCDP